MRPILSAFILAATLFPMAGLRAAEDVTAGRNIARTWCQPCHAVGSSTANDMAIPFSEIVAKRSRQSIAAFLANPHGEMPNIQLARQQIQDVVAYIETMRTK